eukprot:13620982-Alexandrium_andersonii.AAC.1
MRPLVRGLPADTCSELGISLARSCAHHLARPPPGHTVAGLVLLAELLGRAAGGRAVVLLRE